MSTFNETSDTNDVNNGKDVTEEKNIINDDSISVKNDSKDKNKESDDNESSKKNHLIFMRKEVEQLYEKAESLEARISREIVSLPFSSSPSSASSIHPSNLSK